MSLFVDTSVWYAAADKSDIGNTRAKAVLSGVKGTDAFFLVHPEKMRLSHCCPIINRTGSID
jgi:predicted nucleic acid-binding protein